MFLHNFIKFWLFGAILIAIDIYFTIKDNPNVNYRYNEMSTKQKLLTFAQLFVLSVIGSWFIIIWRVVTILFIKYLRRK